VGRSGGLTTELRLATRILYRVSGTGHGPRRTVLARSPNRPRDHRRNTRATPPRQRGPVADLADGAVADPLAASTALARLDESARTMFAAVGDLPADEEIAPIREQAVTQASGALELGSILSEAVAYSAAVQLITRPVDLPTETDIDGLPSVTGAVTGWVGNFISGVSTLPGNDFTDTHRSALSALADSLSDWQAAYLDSLRGRDPERASARIDELETQIRFVRESWSTAAASISEWADQRIETLAVPLVVNR
jgi:hypothetical protein